MKKLSIALWRIGLIYSLTVLFSACQSEVSKAAEQTVEASPDSIYLAQGQAIAGATFAALSAKLGAALKSGGVPEALQVCNLAAMPLVDSLSKVHQAQIKRTSLRTRNPANQPNERERKILEAYQATFAAGQKLKPQTVVIDENTVAFYAPILTAELCLQCHGVLGETLAKDNVARILELYPADQATGYTAGDLRGIWSITLAQNNRQEQSY
jgi:hypothetical protein